MKLTKEECKKALNELSRYAEIGRKKHGAGGGKTKIEAITEAEINLKWYLGASEAIKIPIPKPYEKSVLK